MNIIYLFQNFGCTINLKKSQNCIAGFFYSASTIRHATISLCDIKQNEEQTPSCGREYKEVAVV